MSSPDPEAPSTRPQADDPSPQPPATGVQKALTRYRVMAWATGIWLIALCAEVVAHYAYGVQIRWVAAVHGWVYFVYLLAAFSLAIKVRWPIGKTIGVLLAGTIPLLGIIVEHFQTKKLKAQFAL
jgi:integral membrane protein